MMDTPPLPNPFRAFKFLLALCGLACLAWTASGEELGLEASAGPDRRFGLFTRLFSLDSSEHAAYAEATLAAKPGLVMEAFEWQKIQPSPSTWDWTIPDAVLAAFPADFPFLVELFMVPGWANGNRGSYAPPMRLASNEPVNLSSNPSALSNIGAMSLLEVVTTSPATVYKQGVDYRVDAATGSIRRTLSSSIPDGATLYCRCFLPGYGESKLIANREVTLNGFGWVPLEPGWEPDSDDLGQKFYASVLVSSVPMLTPGEDYVGRYGDPSTIQWLPGSSVPEGTDVKVSYYFIDPQPFAEFARACVQRYGSRIKQWQIWDEPDGMWDVLPNPETYGILAKASSAAIKAADPTAQVLVAGTAGDGINTDFLAKALQYIGSSGVDVITFHTFGRMPESLSRGLSIYQQITDLDATLTALGLTQPFLNTSFGWQTGPGESSESEQAQYLVRSFVQMAAIPRMEGAVWFCLADFGGPGFLFGTTAIDFTPKLSYGAFRVMSEQLSNLPFAERLDLGASNRAGVVFADAERRVSVLWLVGSEASATLPVAGSNVRCVSLYGIEIPILVQNGEVTLPLSEDPIYLVEYNDAPVAEILGSDPFHVKANELLPFNGAGSDTEDGTNVTYAWDWDDGTPDGTAQNPSHAWDEPGVYTVSLIVSDQDGLDSDPVTAQVIVTPKAGERDLFLKRGKFTIDWKAHNDGADKDSFSVQGWLNPAGSNAVLTGATFELSVNGASLGAVPLAANGKGSTATAKAILKAKTGVFSYSIRDADLRNAIGLANLAEAGDVELAIEINVQGAGLLTDTLTAHAQFAYATTQDAFSKGNFNFKTADSEDGYFFAAKTVVTEDKAGAHIVSAKGYVKAPGGASLAPAGDVELTIGAQTVTIPAASLTVSDGVIALNKGAHPDLAKFVLDTNKKQFAIQTNALSGTGVPPAGDAATSFDLLIRIEVPTAGDPIILETSVEILRSSPTSTKWKR